ncbi:putative outer membrane starch-binding protein [Nonlabens dokdonensis]|uniref:RagB/SusD domain protein n=2 Tax=Nonlabens dokdonensis TaxID=328515 RepID=L7WG62_NONDD|nr:RagB/SusD family nutrient uptake outer membrane protein [Nonlabens dokdonensis]AGC77898.1 RagB/SusD domain protein [Nonlabens dokdonensis DSW-6]PZX36666.1 putative outer membrane starch-binding protein [Nonlabens dokdonensis]
MRKIIYFITILISLNSCSDFLEVQPGLLVSVDEQLTTETGVEEALRGMYLDLEATVTSERVFIYPDLIGGNLSFSPDLDATPEVDIDNNFTNSYEFNDMAMESEFQSTYESYYNIINHINILLSRINDFNFLSTERINQLQAELLTSRAYTHYLLSLKFSQHHGFTSNGSHLGIVYNTTPIEVAVDFPARATVAENYQSMKTDLDIALQLYTDVPFIDTRNPIGYFNEISTRAIYSRIALQMEDWQTALDQSSNVINTSGIVLTPAINYVEQWQSVDRINETLLSFNTPLASDNNGTTSSIQDFYSYSSPTLYEEYVVSLDLIELFEPGDIRSQLYSLQNIPTLINGNLISQDYYFTTKYGSTLLDDVRIASSRINVRLSEMYLIAAESQERLSPGNSQSLIWLNDIRMRAGLASITNTNNVLEEIFLERRRELAVEGFLLYDIARFKRDILRDNGCIANVCNLNYPSNFFILPIPFESIELNQNMIQNEGY